MLLLNTSLSLTEEKPFSDCVGFYCNGVHDIVTKRLTFLSQALFGRYEPAMLNKEDTRKICHRSYKPAVKLKQTVFFFVFFLINQNVWCYFGSIF